jgi:beta-glucosidase
MAKAQTIEAGHGKDGVEARIRDLLSRMSIEEKVGQLNQVEGSAHDVVHALGADLRAGQIGSVINQVDPATVNELQRIAREESRLGIPLLIGRDVIHGFKTVAPIPLGQAATWNPDLVEACARMAGEEAAAAGVNWTFAPMIDICRDPRWGRIAESLGEDPVLTSILGAAMVRGFQGETLSDPTSLAACAKHFAGYGASEAGRDYNTTNLPENELRNVHLPPFRAAAEAGAASLMTSFSDIDGIPATANTLLLRDVLRGEWDYDGMVVSDWDAIKQLCTHGLTETEYEAAYQAATAGVDMDMVASAYRNHLADLIACGRIELAVLDRMVANVLRMKFRLGLFDGRTTADAEPSRMASRSLVKQAALQSCVLLKNDDHTLPLDPAALTRLAVIGPLADDPVEQLGTWIFDGDPERSVTPLAALQSLAADTALSLHHVRALATTRSHDQSGFDEAEAAARDADAVLVFLGEEAILSGEAHCRADIDLPGAQVELVKRLKATGKPVIAVIQAGRPLTLASVLDHLDALLFAWHPGSLGGAAIADLLFGRACPSGKLPVSFPKMVGQIPVYYGHKNTGRPPSPDTIIHIDDIQAGAAQTSLGMTAFHLDAGYEPLFRFGFGLSYTSFAYSGLILGSEAIAPDETLTVQVDVTNTGEVAGEEVVQLYLRDRFGSVTRPVRELKAFARVALEPGETRQVRFELTVEDLAFYKRNQTRGAEAGAFDVWVGGDSAADLHAEFTLTEDSPPRP